MSGDQKDKFNFTSNPPAMGQSGLFGMQTGQKSGNMFANQTQQFQAPPTTGSLFFNNSSSNDKTNAKPGSLFGNNNQGSGLFLGGSSGFGSQSKKAKDEGQGGISSGGGGGLNNILNPPQSKTMMPMTLFGEQSQNNNSFLDKQQQQQNSAMSSTNIFGAANNSSGFGGGGFGKPKKPEEQKSQEMLIGGASNSNFFSNSYQSPFNNKPSSGGNQIQNQANFANNPFGGGSSNFGANQSMFSKNSQQQEVKMQIEESKPNKAKKPISINKQLLQFKDCDKDSFEKNIHLIKRFQEIYQQFEQQFTNINSCRVQKINAFQELYNNQRAQCRGFVCQQNQMYKLVLHEQFKQQSQESDKSNIFLQLLTQQLFDIVYLAPTRLALTQKIFHLKALMKFQSGQQTSEELERKLHPNNRNLRGEFIPALIQAISEGRFSLAFRSFTSHHGYLEQDQVCHEVSQQLSNLLHFFQNCAEQPDITNQPIMSSNDTINQMQSFLHILNERQGKFQEILHKMDQSQQQYCDFINESRELIELFAGHCDYKAKPGDEGFLSQCIMKLLFSKYEFGGDPDTYTQLMIKELGQRAALQDEIMEELVKLMVECNNPKMFLTTLCKSEWNVFQQPIMPVHLLNLYIRSLLCPLSYNQEHFEIYELTNLNELHQVYANWLIEIDNLKTKADDKKEAQFKPGDSLFQQFVIPYLQTIVKQKYKKEMFLVIINKQIESVFSNEEFSLKTRRLWQDMLKEGIIESFQNDGDAGAFRLGAKLSVNSEELLTTYWNKLQKLYGEMELIDLQYLVILEELNFVDPKKSDALMNNLAQSTFDLLLAEAKRSPSSLAMSKIAQKIVLTKHQVQSSSHCSFLKKELGMDSARSANSILKPFQRIFSMLFNLCELFKHNRSKIQKQGSVGLIKQIPDNQDHSEMWQCRTNVGQVLQDLLITVDKLPANLFLQLALKDVNYLLCQEKDGQSIISSHVQVNSPLTTVDLSKEVVNYLLKVCNTVENQRIKAEIGRNSSAVAMDLALQRKLCQEISDSLQFY